MTVSMAKVSTIPPAVLRELTRLSASQFARLIDEVGRAWEKDRFERFDRPDRRRAQRAGRKHAISFAARLLMVLMYLRWNISYRVLGGIFGVSKDAVLRSMDELLSLLAARGITAPDGTAVTGPAELEKVLTALERRAACCTRRRDLRACWSAGHMGEPEAALQRAPSSPHPELHRDHRRHRRLVVDRWQLRRLDPRPHRARESPRQPERWQARRSW